MPAEIPASAQDLLERPLLCALCTINPDGQPHTVPVWFDFEAPNIRVNSPDSARKARNMDVGTKVTVLIVDPENGYHWVEIMGHIAAIHTETEGGRDHINKLSLKYRGDPEYKSYGGRSENRTMYEIAPDKVHGQ